MPRAVRSAARPSQGGRLRGPSDTEYEQATGLRLALHAFGRRSEQVTRKHGLTIERYQLLLLIRTAGRRGETVTVGEIAKTLHLATSTVTQLVRRAENLRLVRRELSEHDARIRYLQLTEEGEDRLRNAVRELRADRSHVLHLLATLNRERPSAR